jgi:hypothetical protein
VGIVFARVSYTVSTLLSGPIRGLYDSPFHGATTRTKKREARLEFGLMTPRNNFGWRDCVKSIFGWKISKTKNIRAERNSADLIFSNLLV